MVDLGGASSRQHDLACGSGPLNWAFVRAVVLLLHRGIPIPSNPDRGPRDPNRFYGSTSANWGSPQTEFDVPYGNVAQNVELRADCSAIR